MTRPAPGGDPPEGPSRPAADPATGRRRQHLALGVACAILVVGCVLRGYAAMTDFWLDEIITLDWPRNFSYWQLLADPATKHDNNHVLNSMWMKFVHEPTPPAHWWPYRLFALVTGSIAAVAMGAIGWRRGALAGVLATGFGAFSYVLIHYSSESRGYAPVCCFALLSWLAVERALRRPGVGIAVTFWILVLLGVLSHSTYAFAYIGLAAWSGAAFLAGSKGATLPRLLLLHLVPVVTLGVIYVVRIHGMAIGGGPEFGLPRVLTNALAHVVGWAWDDTWKGTTAALVALALAATGCVLRFRDARHRDHAGAPAAPDTGWVFFATILVVTPLLIALVLKPRILFMRYVLVCLPFLMILVADLLARAFWHWGRIGRVAAVLLLAVITWFNARRMEGLLTAGRGQFLAALRYIVAHDPEPKIRVTSNEGVHGSFYVSFYNRFLDRPLEFVKPQDSAGSVSWLIFETQRPPTEQMTGNRSWGMKHRGTSFLFQEWFPYASISGAHWMLFQRQE